MSRSSDRAAVEPLAALIAVCSVSLGLALYAGVVDDAIRNTAIDRNQAEPTADAVEARLSSAGIVHPEQIDHADAAMPSGYDWNVTVRVDRFWNDSESWTRGTNPPPSADRERRIVSVRLGPGDVRRGHLTVWVWT